MSQCPASCALIGDWLVAYWYELYLAAEHDYAFFSGRFRDLVVAVNIGEKDCGFVLHRHKVGVLEPSRSSGDEEVLEAGVLKECFR